MNDATKDNPISRKDEDTITYKKGGPMGLLSKTCL